MARCSRSASQGRRGRTHGHQTQAAWSRCRTCASNGGPTVLGSPGAGGGLPGGGCWCRSQDLGDQGWLRPGAQGRTLGWMVRKERLVPWIGALEESRAWSAAWSVAQRPAHQKIIVQDEVKSKKFLFLVYTVATCEHWSLMKNLPLCWKEQQWLCWWS